MLLILFAVVLVFASVALLIFNVMSQRSQGAEKLVASAASQITW